MSYITGILTPSYAGIKTIPTGFTPKGVRVTVSAKATSDNVNHLSIGTADVDGYMSYNSTYSDSTTHKSWVGTDKIVSHYEKVGGVLREVNVATLDSFTTSSVKLNVTKVDSIYNYVIEAWD